MGMPIREKQVCNKLISWPCFGHYSAFGPLYFPLSTSKVYASMKHKTNFLNMTYDMYMNVDKKCNMI